VQRWLTRLDLAPASIRKVHRAEGPGLDEFEIYPALALGEEGNATADQHLRDDKRAR
jgi:hypothetical protein